MTTTAPPPPEAASASPSRRRPPASRRNEKRRRRPSTQARRTPSSWRRAARRARLRDPGRRSDGHGWRRARLPDVRRAPVRRAVREGRRRDGEDGARSSGNLRQPVLRRHRREHRAAGEATRFGAPKQRLLLPSVLDRVTRAPVDEIVVVSGAYELEPPSNSLLQGVSVRIVECAEWARGPGASLRCGLMALGQDVEAAVVVLADGPDLSPGAVERVLDAWRERGGVTAASYEGGRGHPLVLGRDDWDGIPDEGLRDRPVRLIPCDDLGSPGDVDTPDD